MLPVAGNNCNYDMTTFGYAGSLSKLCPVSCGTCITGTAVGTRSPTPRQTASPTVLQQAYVVPEAIRGSSKCGTCQGYRPDLGALNTACPAGAAVGTEECCAQVRVILCLLLVVMLVVMLVVVVFWVLVVLLTHFFCCTFFVVGSSVRRNLLWEWFTEPCVFFCFLGESDGQRPMPGHLSARYY